VWLAASKLSLSLGLGAKGLLCGVAVQSEPRVSPGGQRWPPGQDTSRSDAGRGDSASGGAIVTTWAGHLHAGRQLSSRGLRNVPSPPPPTVLGSRMTWKSAGRVECGPDAG
jgi:hypothetical protein